MKQREGLGIPKLKRERKEREGTQKRAQTVPVSTVGHTLEMKEHVVYVVKLPGDIKQLAHGQLVFSSFVDIHS